MEENNKIPPQVEDILNELNDYANETGNYVNNAALEVKHINDISNKIYDNTITNIEKLKGKGIPNVDVYIKMILDKLAELIIAKHDGFYEVILNSYTSGKEKRFEVVQSNMNMFIMTTSLIIMKLEILPLSQEMKNTLLSFKEINCKGTKDAASDNKGCYIATMVYGSYDASQVLILREFRDTVLDKSTLGRLFIRFYYKVSPGIVNMFKNHNKVNLFIKSILDSIIKLLKHD